MIRRTFTLSKICGIIGVILFIICVIGIILNANYIITLVLLPSSLIFLITAVIFSKRRTIYILLSSFVITFILFWLVPNGTLISWCCLIIVSIQIIFNIFRDHKRKHWKKYLILLLIVISGLLFLLMFLLLPQVMNALFSFQNIYTMISPQGFSYAWASHFPAELGAGLFSVFFAIIIIKLAIRLFGNGEQRLVQYINYIFAILSDGYFIISLILWIPNLIGLDVSSWFFNILSVAIIYDIPFVWIPFVLIFFLISNIRKRKVPQRI